MAHLHIYSSEKDPGTTEEQWKICLVLLALRSVPILYKNSGTMRSTFFGLLQKISLSHVPVGILIILLHGESHVVCFEHYVLD